MKRILIFCVIISLMLCGCTAQESETSLDVVEILNEAREKGNSNTFVGVYPSVEMELLSVDEAASLSNNIISAELTDFAVNGVEVLLAFSPCDNYKGQIQGDFIVKHYLTSVHAANESAESYYLNSVDDYEVGKIYMLFLQKFDSVYDEYTFYCNLSRPIEYGNFEEACADAFGTEGLTADNFASVICEAEDKSISPDYYTKSTDRNVIEEECSFMVKLTVKELYVEGATNRDSFVCEVDEVIKGNIGSQIIVPFFKDTVEIGKSYTVCLNGEDYGLVYTLSSKNSVFPIGEQQ